MTLGEHDLVMHEFLLADGRVPGLTPEDLVDLDEGGVQDNPIVLRLCFPGPFCDSSGPRDKNSKGKFQALADL